MIPMRINIPVQESSTLQADGGIVEGDYEVNPRGIRFRRRSRDAAQTYEEDEEDEVVGEVSAMDIEKLTVMGKGASGVVRKVRHIPSGTFMALKVMAVEIMEAGGGRKQTFMELKTLHQCTSPEVVAFYGAYQHDGRIHLLMEFMDAGSLSEILKTVGRIEEPILAIITRRVLTALHYLHTKLHVLHRDIKPSNILVNTAGEVKLCDFGVSGQLEHTLAQMRTAVGTVTYMSPERMVGGAHDATSDLWSVGVSLVELASGKYPYQIDDTGHMQYLEMFKFIVDNPPPSLPPDLFTADFLEFVELTVRKDPRQRPSVAALLGHPFLEPTLSSRAAEDAVMIAWVRSSDPEERSAEKEKRLNQSRVAGLSRLDVENAHV